MKLFALFTSFVCSICGFAQHNNMHFKFLNPEQTGVEFVNKIAQNDSVNFWNFEYIFNGGGVAVGDVNGDDLPDLYFTGASVGDKLFINKGNLKFKDVTKSHLPKISQENWSTGVTMVDINNDGFLDIYVCKSGTFEMNPNYTNLLLINNGKGKFSDQTEKYGIGGNEKSVQSSFFDYDLDGDLDLMVISHQVNVKKIKKYYKQSGKTSYTNKLYRNDGDSFTDVSNLSGISLGKKTFSLGMVVDDFNNDGYPDVYITNDFIEGDNLYINQKDGTFKDEILERTRQIAQYAMGVDVADINNDGYADLLTVDMATSSHFRSKTNMPSMSTKLFNNLVNAGNQYQYMYNTLQLNNGNGSFSNISLMSGISSTEWSWGSLIADFDNDGLKDIVIANGYLKDVRNNDFIYNIDQERINNDPVEYIESYPSSLHPTNIFKNKDGLTFEKKIEDWGLNKPLNTNGLAYADLDLDGDLDLIFANLETPCLIAENKNNLGNSFLEIELVGTENNLDATGTSITAYASAEMYSVKKQNTRGFQSSVDPVLHLGLGKIDLLDSVVAVWPNGKRSVLKNVKTKQRITLKYTELEKTTVNNKAIKTLFTDLSENYGLYSKDQKFNDFDKEILLPHKMSEIGPFMAVGDVNADGLDDMFIGGAKGETGRLYLQTDEGYILENTDVWQEDFVFEDVNAAFLDIDNDKDLDLYVVRGGNEFGDNPLYFQDNIYLNDGKGNFTKSKDALPEMHNSGESIAYADIDKDGDLDLFVGNRQTPRKYPYSSKSYLLINENGKFKDATESWSSEFLTMGMITDAVFDDYNNDGTIDLIAVGEWTGIQFFKNTGISFERDRSAENLLKEVGWWSAIKVIDLDNDGVNEYIVGNIGLNNKFHPSFKKPFGVNAKDFDNNGTCDIVLSKYEDDVLYPVRGRECSSQQMPFITEKFPSYEAFASAPLIDIYSDEELKTSLSYKATNFASVIVKQVNGKFVVQELPMILQKSPITAVEVIDVNKDNYLDFVVVGNKWEAEVETPRYDAGRGDVIINNGDFTFEVLSPVKTGFDARFNARDVQRIGNNLVVTNNNGPIQIFKINQ